MKHYVLIEGQTVAVDDLTQWAQWYELAARTGLLRIAETLVGEYRVSTVFLGLDHNFGGGPPLLFETMTFALGESGEQWRYTTQEQALAGHLALVQRLEEQALAAESAAMLAWIKAAATTTEGKRDE